MQQSICGCHYPVASYGIEESPMKLLIDRIKSPIGEVRIVSDGEYLRALDFADYDERMQRLLARHYGSFELVPTKNPNGLSEIMERYFAGELTAIDTIKVAANGTAFQTLVWRHLRDVPLGKTWSYGELARRIGKPKASRAVGLANGSNPIAIVVPCHRVIGANGSLTGYGGGMERKQWLLVHEGVNLL
ncbi:MAG: methylated-DNA-[protein]-cysteine S-methyltransferase [Gammaproteobacteria bacterium]|jgi:methylated-DNA-[protein]-cysteine S-methyltransferase